MNENIASAENTKATEIDELSEDMEMISPGQMLSDAREKKGLTQEQIAKKLNFRLLLVKNIEQDKLDQSLPATFNRGYLCNYAKLVGIESVDVLASFDALDAAQIQRSEMLSFSNLTEKQAEHSRLMWVSYLIVAILIGSTVLWWLQDTNQQTVEQVKESNVKTTLVAKQEKAQQKKSENTKPLPIESGQNKDDLTSQEKIIVPVEVKSVLESSIDNNTEQAVLAAPLISTAIFTFSGDCWVNIYDASGERIAWGVKKTGYVMTVKGKSPLKITLGKPELATIVFNGQSVDMSPFNVGNIAKFTLPVNPE